MGEKSKEELEQLCSSIAKHMARKYSEDEIHEFVDHIPELLAVGRSRRLYNLIKKSLNSKKSFITWVGGTMIFWATVGERAWIWMKAVYEASK